MRRGRTTRRLSPASPSRSWTDPFVGSLTFVRVYSGTVSSGTSVLNSVKDKQRARRPHAADACQSPRRHQGSARRRHRRLRGPQDHDHRRDAVRSRTTPVILERMEFPDPVIEIAIEPKTKADQEKMGMALARLAHEDPSFRVTTDQETGQTIIKGMGELHLEIIVDSHEARVQGRRQCRRAAGGLSRDDHAPADIDYTHKKQTGGSGQFARVKIAFRAAAAGLGLRVRERGRRRHGAEGIHPRRRKGRRRLARQRRARRLPGDRLQGRADRRRVSRSRLRARSLSKSRRARR